MIQELEDEVDDENKQLRSIRPRLQLRNDMQDQHEAGEDEIEELLPKMRLQQREDNEEEYDEELEESQEEYQSPPVNINLRK